MVSGENVMDGLGNKFIDGFGENVVDGLRLEDHRGSQVRMSSLVSFFHTIYISLSSICLVSGWSTKSSC